MEILVLPAKAGVILIRGGEYESIYSAPREGGGDPRHAID